MGCTHRGHLAPHANRCRHLGFQVHGAKIIITVTRSMLLYIKNYNSP